MERLYVRTALWLQRLQELKMCEVCEPQVLAISLCPHRNALNREVAQDPMIGALCVLMCEMYDWCVSFH